MTTLCTMRVVLLLFAQAAVAAGRRSEESVLMRPGVYFGTTRPGDAPVMVRARAQCNVFCERSSAVIFESIRRESGFSLIMLRCRLELPGRLPPHPLRLRTCVTPASTIITCKHGAGTTTTDATSADSSLAMMT